MEKKISVLIADDHPIFREGLRMMLKKQSLIDVVGEAGDGIKVMTLLAKIKPDVILMDIQMPRMDGVDAIRQIALLYPDIRILALTMHNQDFMIVDVLEAGALGYLLKDAGKAEIMEAIETVHMHHPYYSKTISFETIRRISASQFNPHRNAIYNLSDVDKQIICCICEEMTSKEIASKLFLSVHTVESYRKDIAKKIGAKSMAGVVIFAIKKGIYKLNSN